MSDADQQARESGARTGEPAPGLDLPRLLQSAAAGDEDAWRAIVHLYARRVYALARSRLGGRTGAGSGAQPGSSASRRIRASSPDGMFVQGLDIAEEVTQSVFVTVASKLASGEYTEQGRFESWLFRVAMNRIRDEVRRSRRQAAPTDPDALDASAAPADSGTQVTGEEELAALRLAMSRLAEQDREIIELRHHAGMSFRRMAELLAEPLGTLLARHHRALRKLKELISGDSDAAPGQPARATGDAP